jgi:hypothetical protein
VLSLDYAKLSFIAWDWVLKGVTNVQMAGSYRQDGRHPMRTLSKQDIALKTYVHVYIDFVQNRKDWTIIPCESIEKAERSLAKVAENGYLEETQH